MDTSSTSQNKDSVNADRSQKLPVKCDSVLMVSGLVRPKQVPEGGGPVEVVRGMTILTKEGREAGRVAAVVVDSRSQAVTHVVLGRLRPALEYRLVPVDLVERIADETVCLNIDRQIVETLPLRQES